jgi:hypothetical protein
MRQRERAGWQAANDRSVDGRAAAHNLAVLIAQGYGNMLAPAGWEVLVLCDHLCAEPHPCRSGRYDSKDVRS